MQILLLYSMVSYLVIFQVMSCQFSQKLWLLFSYQMFYAIHTLRLTGSALLHYQIHMLTGTCHMIHTPHTHTITVTHMHKCAHTLSLHGEEQLTAAGLAEVQETAVGRRGQSYSLSSVPLHPPATLAHKSTVVAGPNMEEFDATPNGTKCYTPKPLCR